MQPETQHRLLKKTVAELPYAAAIRAAGIRRKHVYVLRDRIGCDDWRHVSRYFVKPTPRRYVTVHPGRVVRAMQAQGLW